MPLILGTNSIKDTGFDVANSLRFNSGSSDNLSRTQSTGNQRTYTVSFWVKRSALDNQEYIVSARYGNQTRYQYIRWNGDSDSKKNCLDIFSGIYSTSSTSTSMYFVTNRVFRDVSAWYHIVLAVDTTQSTESNRVKIYINGVQETSFQQSTYPSQNQQHFFNINTTPNEIGVQGGGSYLNSYLSEVVLVDGQQLDATSFGEFDSDSNIWKPIDVSGLTFGTNGFYLDFENSGSLGADVSGNGNNFTVNNLTAIDQTTDTCTNNFATWNSLFRKGTTTPAFSEGNLKSTFDDGGANEFALTTFGADTGKWYAEVKWTSATGTGATATGILDMAYTGTADPNTSVTNAFGYFGNGNKNVSGTGSSYGASYTSGDIIGIALNCDDNQVTFYKNGASQGVISIISGVTYGIFASDYNNKVAELNTGSPPFTISSGNADGNGYGNFEYSVPSGYYALNTKNLAEYG